MSYLGKVADAFREHIRPLFESHIKITLLARNPKDDGSEDVLITTDTDEGIRALVNRRTKTSDQDKIYAERYRFLREGGSYVVKTKGATFHCGGHVYQEGSRGYPEAFDAAIDEAMKNAERKNSKS